MRMIVVVPYDPRWPRQFEVAAEQLRAVLGASLLVVHHIGSTSVPGLPAKPILDLMPVVRSLDEVDAANSAMQYLGYTPRGEYGIPGRRYFIQEQHGERTQHVHVFEEGDPNVARHLVLRDFLCAHPEQAKRYSELKRHLAERFPNDAERYASGKEELISELQALASAWSTQHREAEL